MERSLANIMRVTISLRLIGVRIEIRATRTPSTDTPVTRISIRKLNSDFNPRRHGA